MGQGASVLVPCQQVSSQYSNMPMDVQCEIAEFVASSDLFAYSQTSLDHFHCAKKSIPRRMGSITHDPKFKLGLFDEQMEHEKMKHAFDQASQLTNDGHLFALLSHGSCWLLGSPLPSSINQPSKMNDIRIKPLDHQSYWPAYITAIQNDKEDLNPWHIYFDEENHRWYAFNLETGKDILLGEYSSAAILRGNQFMIQEYQSRNRVTFMEIDPVTGMKQYIRSTTQPNCMIRGLPSKLGENERIIGFDHSKYFVRDLSEKTEEKIKHLEFNHEFPILSEGGNFVLYEKDDDCIKKHLIIVDLRTMEQINKMKLPFKIEQAWFLSPDRKFIFVKGDLINQPSWIVNFRTGHWIPLSIDPSIKVIFSEARPINHRWFKVNLNGQLSIRSFVNPTEDITGDQACDLIVGLLDLNHIRANLFADRQHRFFMLEY